MNTASELVITIRPNKVLCFLLVLLTVSLGHMIAKVRQGQPAYQYYFSQAGMRTGTGTGTKEPVEPAVLTEPEPDPEPRSSVMSEPEPEPEPESKV